MAVGITAITPDMLATILTRAGGHVTTEMIEADIAAGAPMNADGTMNLVHYAAWLAQEMHRRGR